MRYAIVTDIHANLQAWQAVVADCAREGVSHMICLGDVVGYGPEPAETLAAVRRAACAMAQGNHDAAAAGVLDPARFTAFAQKTARRAMLALSDAEKAFLADRPLVLLGEGFAATHGSFFLPHAFYYVVTEADAELCFQMQRPERALFVGHTHHPCVFELDGETGRVAKLPPADFTFRLGCRYLVNPGSVGFPREADTRAMYVIYDSLADRVTFRRVPYDLDRFRLSVIRHGYHLDDYWFLNRDNAERVASQQSFSFMPVPVPEKAPEAPVARAVDFAPKGSGRWGMPLIFFTGLLFLCGLSLLVLFALPRDVEIALPDPALIPGGPLEPLAVAELENWRASILPPVPFTQGPDGAIPGWRLSFSHQRHQQILLQAQLRGCGFRFVNTAQKGTVSIETPLLDLTDLPVHGLALRGEARCLAGAKGGLRCTLAQFAGEADALSLVRADSFSFTPSADPAERGVCRVEERLALDPVTRFAHFTVQAEIVGEALLEAPVAEPVLTFPL